VVGEGSQRVSKQSSRTGRIALVGSLALVAGLSLVGDRAIRGAPEDSAAHRRPEVSAPAEERSTPRDIPPNCGFEGAAGGGGYAGGRVRCPAADPIAPWRSL